MVDGGRTHTEIMPLNEDFQRVEELAAMLGTTNESGFQSARELLVAASDYKRGQRDARAARPADAAVANHGMNGFSAIVWEQEP